MLAHRFVILLATMLSLILATPAQNTAPPKGTDTRKPFVIRSTPQTVLVDFIATGKDHAFINNLTKDDIEILENGVPQPVTFIQLVNRLGTENQEVTPSGEGVPNLPDKSLLIFVLDTETMLQNDMQQAKAAIRRFVESSPRSDDQLMLVTVGSRMKVAQRFTDNRQAFLQALDPLITDTNAVANNLSFDALVNRIHQTFAEMRDDFTLKTPMDKPRPAFEKPADSLEPVLNMAANQGLTYLDNVERRLTFLTGSMLALTQSLRGIPGRKNIIFFSGGYTLDPQPIIQVILDAGGKAAFTRASAALSSGQRRHVSHYIKQLAEEANRSRVAIYSVDPRGLMTAATSGDRYSPSFDQNRDKMAGIINPQDFLYAITRDTGGLCFVNSNDLTRGIKQADTDAKRYYLAGYTPLKKRVPETYYKIEVRIKRPDTQVRARQGYMESDDTELAKNDIMNALRFPSLYRTFPVKVNYAVHFDQLSVETWVPTTNLSFTRTNGQFICPVEIYGALVSEENGRQEVRPVFAKKYDLKATPEQVQGLQTLYEHVTSKIDKDVMGGNYMLPGTLETDGHAELVVVVRQGVTHRISTFSHEISLK